MSAGAYRGYGATQGIFAVESAIDELAHRMGMDPAELRMRNMVREGDRMPAYYGEISQSCAMDRCLEAVREAIGWDEKYPRRVLENGHIRGVGMALDMQGSGISGVDVGSVTLRVSDDGGYTMLLGCADMGTGCDTILAQMAADMLNCPIENIAVKRRYRRVPLRLRLLRLVYHLHHRHGLRQVLQRADRENHRLRGGDAGLQAGRGGI